MSNSDASMAIHQLTKYLYYWVKKEVIILLGEYDTPLQETYVSKFGRYDVMLKPSEQENVGIILEFKVHDSKEEASLEETEQAALKQIAEKKYEQAFLAQGIGAERIRKSGFCSYLYYTGILGHVNKGCINCLLYTSRFPDAPQSRFPAGSGSGPSF